MLTTVPSEIATSTRITGDQLKDEFAEVKRTRQISYDTLAESPTSDSAINVGACYSTQSGDRISVGAAIE